MKKFPTLVLAMLCVVLSCETSDLNSEVNPDNLYSYITNQQIQITESFIIDFEDFSPGDIVSDIPIVNPFENAQVEGITMAFPNSNAAMIFDSSNPTGNDFDLGTPNQMFDGPGIGNGGASNDTALGNVLILSEDLDSNDPDDIFEIGASFVFDFSANDNIILNTFDILDIEASSNPTVVTLFNLEGNVLLSKEIMPGGDNSKTNVNLENTPDVAFMEIIMNSSGAIDNIALELESEEPCVECDSSITELTFRYNGISPEAVVRIETPEGNILFENTLQTNEEFSITGNASDGTFGSNIIILIDNEQLSEIATDCSQAVGPGFFIPGLEIVSGMTLSGGQLCPVEISIG